MLFAGASLDPEFFNKKINLAIFWAPTAAISNSPSAAYRAAATP